MPLQVESGRGVSDGQLWYVSGNSQMRQIMRGTNAGVK